MIKENSKTRGEYFHPQELLLLASSFGINRIYGLADSRVLQLQGVTFEKAYGMLQKREFFDKEGNITQKAVGMIEMLKEYSQSEKYVQIQDYTFAFFEKDSDEVMAIKEIKQNKLYSFHVVSKTIVFETLSKEFSIFKREPSVDELNFMNKVLSKSEIEELEITSPLEDFMYFRFAHAKEVDDKEKEMIEEDYVAFERKGKLLKIDLQTKKILRMSQYMFWKKVFDEMDFPYGGAKDVK